MKQCNFTYHNIKRHHHCAHSCVSQRINYTQSFQSDCGIPRRPVKCHVRFGCWATSCQKSTSQQRRNPSLGKYRRQFGLRNSHYTPYQPVIYLGVSIQARIAELGVYKFQISIYKYGFTAFQ